jgi:transposase
MTSKKFQPRYSPELRDRAVCMVLEHRQSYPSLWAAIEAMAPKFGCAPQTLNEWVKKAETDSGVRPGLTSDERAKMKAMEREIKELRLSQ